MRQGRVGDAWVLAQGDLIFPVEYVNQEHSRGGGDEYCKYGKCWEDNKAWLRFILGLKYGTTINLRNQSGAFYIKSMVTITSTIKDVNDKETGSAFRMSPWEYWKIDKETGVTIHPDCIGLEYPYSEIHCKMISDIVVNASLVWLYEMDGYRHGETPESAAPVKMNATGGKWSSTQKHGVTKMKNGDDGPTNAADPSGVDGATFGDDPGAEATIIYRMHEDHCTQSKAWYSPPSPMFVPPNPGGGTPTPPSGGVPPIGSAITRGEDAAAIRVLKSGTLVNNDTASDVWARANRVKGTRQ